MYADYSYYADHYGGDIPEREYPSAERRAEAYIRKLTYVRGNIFAVENTAVKDAVCAVADVYYSCKKKQEAQKCTRFVFQQMWRMQISIFHQRNM